MSRYMRQVGIKKRKHVSVMRSEDIKLVGIEKEVEQSAHVGGVVWGAFWQRAALTATRRGVKKKSIWKVFRLKWQ